MVKQSTKKGSVPLVEVSNLNFAYGQKEDSIRYLICC